MSIPNLSTAASFASKIPGANIVSGALSLGTGGASLTDLVSNPYNPMKGALSRPDPVLTHMWYIELPGYDFGLGASGGPLSSLMDKASSSLAFGANNALNAVAGGPVLGLDGFAKLQSAAGAAVGAAASAVSGLVSKVTGLGYEYVEEATLPFRQYTQRTLWRAGNQRKYPDNTYQVPNLRLTIYGDSQGQALQYLNAWHNAPMLPLKPNDKQGPRWVAPEIAVKRKITAVVLAPDLSKVAHFVYTGCWIESISELQMESAQGQALKYAVDFSVDDVFITVSGGSGLIGAAAGLASSVTGMPFPI